ncbi:MAG TPA: hypothetical protein ENI92_03620 [Bacteroidetes bacterium]|nr:hypothetical protein [Bacteroidota bacterium]
MRRAILTVLPFLLLAGIARGGMNHREIVVYARGIAEIHETHTVSLQKGEGEITFAPLPMGTYGETATLEVLKPGKVETRSLGYSYNLLTMDRLWEAQVGRPVTLSLADDTLRGTLRRVTDDKLFLEPEGEPGVIRVIDRAEVDDPTLDTLPEGLTLAPSLLWRYKARSGGNAEVRLTYMCEGMEWSAEYRVVFEKGIVNLRGDFVVDNDCGMTFPYDQLVLMAGEVHLAGDKRSIDRMNPKPGAAGAAGRTPFGDLRRFIFDEPGRLVNGRQTSLPRYDENGWKAGKKLVYDATIFNDRVTRHLTFTPTAPLPAGKVRIYLRAGDRLYFSGEDEIDDTPAGSPVDLTVGYAFDITAERVRKREVPSPEGGTSQTFVVTLGNSSGGDVTVQVLERLFGDWRITSATVGGEPVTPTVEDARTVSFLVPLPAGSTTVLEYEIHYQR